MNYEEFKSINKTSDCIVLILNKTIEIVNNHITKNEINKQTLVIYTSFMTSINNLIANSCALNYSIKLLFKYSTNDEIKANRLKKYQDSLNNIIDFSKTANNCLHELYDSDISEKLNTAIEYLDKINKKITKLEIKDVKNSIIVGGEMDLHYYGGSLVDEIYTGYEVSWNLIKNKPKKKYPELEIYESMHDLELDFKNKLMDFFKSCVNNFKSEVINLLVYHMNKQDNYEYFQNEEITYRDEYGFIDKVSDPFILLNKIILLINKYDSKKILDVIKYALKTKEKPEPNLELDSIDIYSRKELIESIKSKNQYIINNYIEIKNEYKGNQPNDFIEKLNLLRPEMKKFEEQINQLMKSIYNLIIDIRLLISPENTHTCLKNIEYFIFNLIKYYFNGNIDIFIKKDPNIKKYNFNDPNSFNEYVKNII